MPRILLTPVESPHAASAEIGYSLPAVRLFTHLRLRTASGWTPFGDAIIDTGAPVSLLPRDLWNDAVFRAIGRVRIGGIVHRDECRIPGTLAVVECQIADRSRSLGSFSLHALLSDSDAVPALLGMSGLLDQLRLVVDLPAAQLSLERGELSTSVASKPGPRRKQP